MAAVHAGAAASYLDELMSDGRRAGRSKRYGFIIDGCAGRGSPVIGGVPAVSIEAMTPADVATENTKTSPRVTCGASLAPCTPMPRKGASLP
jgi:hypothetical protein